MAFVVTEEEHDKHAELCKRMDEIRSSKYFTVPRQR